jgi:hypothetical protein
MLEALWEFICAVVSAPRLAKGREFS